MTIPMLRVENLARHYPIRRSSSLFGKPQVLRAVDGISFDLDAGRTLGLVGESGCGKSTTAKMILGLAPSSHGEVHFEGTRVTHKRTSAWRHLRRRMQMVYQDPLSALDRRLRVIDQVTEPLIVLGSGEASEHKQWASEIMESVGLTPHLFERYPHELSGGQRQRVVLARALVLKPGLLVCDEPISALDVSIQAQVINLLAELKQRLGVAMLFISHDLKVVRHICDDVAVMYLGKIVEQGPAEELFRNPAHPYTRALISAIPSPWRRDGASKRIILQGEPPNPIQIPRGCAFHPRCAHAMPQCRHIVPPLLPTEGKRQVACHLHAADTINL